MSLRHLRGQAALVLILSVTACSNAVEEKSRRGVATEEPSSTESEAKESRPADIDWGEDDDQIVAAANADEMYFDADRTAAALTTAQGDSDLVYRKLLKCNGPTCPADCFAADRGRLHTVFFGYKKIHATGRILRAKAVWPPGFDPASGRRLPVIAFFHGGGLDSRRMKYDYWSPALNYFASRGMLAISFEYRLSIDPPAGRSAREPVVDSRSAIRWIRKNARALHVDPDRIVASGNSAGGYLAIAVAVMDGVNEEVGADLKVSPKPNFIFSGYPMVDLTLHRYEAAFSLTKERARRLPRTFILQEVGDPVKVTPPKLGRQFCENAPGRCNYYSFDATRLYGGHVHDLFGPPATYPTAMSILDSFMIRNKVIAGVPSASLQRVQTSRPHCKR